MKYKVKRNHESDVNQTIAGVAQGRQREGKVLELGGTLTDSK